MEPARARNRIPRANRRGDPSGESISRRPATSTARALPWMRRPRLRRGTGRTAAVAGSVEVVVSTSMESVWGVVSAMVARFFD